MAPPPVYPTSPSPSPSSSLTNQSSGEPSNKKYNPYRRPPSRRIMRHVLRSRVEAVRALATFFEELELLSFGSAEGVTEEIRSSLHLAQIQKGSSGTGYRSREGLWCLPSRRVGLEMMGRKGMSQIGGLLLLRMRLIRLLFLLGCKLVLVVRIPDVIVSSLV